ncbi:venom serine carboxypeptidase [Vespula squamosa]|uniref:Venom serine carboxypeptidase n=1 Tax=Vespula squamosa TaxID=30214 RepID=A0ABD2BTC9_VESSQ
MDNSWKVLLLIVSGEQRKNKQSSVIVITVGIRYNFTKNYKGYTSNETQVARDIHNALVQFFKLFPELRNNNCPHIDILGQFPI